VYRHYVRRGPEPEDGTDRREKNIPVWGRENHKSEYTLRDAGEGRVALKKWRRPTAAWRMTPVIRMITATTTINKPRSSTDNPLRMKWEIITKAKDML